MTNREALFERLRGAFPEEEGQQLIAELDRFVSVTTRLAEFQITAMLAVASELLRKGKYSLMELLQLATFINSCR